MWFELVAVCGLPTDKIMRLHAQTGMIENGFVHIPETAPWLAEYLHEMSIPKGKHDDQVDSTAQFLDWFKKPFPCQGSFEYYRRLAQAAKVDMVAGDAVAAISISSSIS
jgi:hypothetical protein